MARFDTRLPDEQKARFEQAAQLGGFRSLTDFILYAANDAADRIFEQKANILASERDAEVFFDLLMEAPAPNEYLKAAAQKHQERLEE